MNQIYPWQQQQWQTLMSQRSQDRLHHAYLFCGGEGLGQLDFAKVFAQTVLCQNAQTDQFCGHCRSCQLFACGNHPDIFTVGLLEKSKVIKIDQIRHLVDQLNQSAQLGNGQVAIIYPAEAMHRAAANALLKTLEEPSGNVTFVLISHRQGSIPVTIMSRCQKVNFQVKNQSETIQWLAQQIGSKEQATQLLPIADYAPLRVLQFVEFGYLELRNELLRQLIQISENKIHPIMLAEKYLKQDILMLLCVLMSIVTDLSRLQLGVTNQFIANRDCEADLKRLCHVVSMIDAQNYLMQLQQSQHSFQGAIALNVQLFLENLFLKWMEITAC